MVTAVQTGGNRTHDLTVNQKVVSSIPITYPYIILSFPYIFSLYLSNSN